MAEHITSSRSEEKFVWDHGKDGPGRQISLEITDEHTKRVHGNHRRNYGWCPQNGQRYCKKMAKKKASQMIIE